VSELQARLEGLSPEKRALFELLLAERRKAAGGAEAGGEAAAGGGAAVAAARGEEIPRVPRDGPLPLSFAQERLWFLEQMHPDSGLYNVPAAARLRGALDAAALERALAAVVARHEALRTVFRVDAEDGSAPQQVVLPSVDVALQRDDLSAGVTGEAVGGATVDGLAVARARAIAEAARPFDLANGPLLRALLLRLGDDDHVLVLTLHHVVTDGWSMGVLLRETAAAYEALLAGRAVELPPLPIQYADFAAWQRAHLSGERLAAEVEFWKRAVAGAPHVLELPADRQRPRQPSYRGASASLRLGPRLVGALEELGRGRSATLFMTLLAAFDVLLSRLTGQEQLLVGSPIANRHRGEVEGLVGCFVNTLALRADLRGDPRFIDLLTTVRDATLRAYEHQDLPFEKLVEELQPARDASRNPLFQTFFVLQNAPLPALRLPGLTLEPLALDAGVVKFDFSLAALPEADGALTLQAEYMTELFDGATVERWLGCYRTLLEGIVRQPEQRVSAQPLLGAAQRRQVVVEWNATREEYPERGGLHELVAAQAARTPEAIAVSCGSETLTYAELERRAARLARELLRRGVGADTLVGVAMERSLELMVALLGVLKAGGAYVALDPAYPRERLRAMLDDARPTVVLTQSHVRGRLPLGGDEDGNRGGDGVRLQPAVLTLDPRRDSADLGAGGDRQAPVVLTLDAGWDGADLDGAGDRDERDNRPPATADEQLAYVIFTSGSTGRPKGVANTHGGIRNRLLWMQRAYNLTAADRVLQKTPYSFDVSVWELFWPLLAGARLVFARPGGHQDSAYLARLIREAEITTLHFVPSMLQLFLEEPGVESCTSVARVICSGEALPPHLVERCHARLGAELHNLYGPTEAAVDVTAWECRRGETGHTLPIGRPIANTQIYVVDREMQPVPPGVAGELLIGGAGLARGYVRRPDLTAERFIPDPFSGVPGARLYRTGDLARWRGDGAIEYLGRADFQVKIRGHRIELGEVEAALRAQPGVGDAVVVAREDGGGDRSLVGYVVPAASSSSGPTPAFDLVALRRALAERLPEAMIPAALVPLAALPLLPNGKLDRAALPAPERTRAETAAGFTAPRTALEQQVAAIWRDVLDLPEVGVEDDFFALGGDSFKAIRVVRRCGEGVAVMDLFRHPTIRGLADCIEGGGGAEGGILETLRPPAAGAPVLLCVPYGGGSPVVYRPLLQELPAEWGLYAVALPGHDPATAADDSARPAQLRASRAQEPPLRVNDPALRAHDPALRAQDSAPPARADESQPSVEEIARAVADEVIARDLGPLSIYGHCVGTAVALETARLLEAAGRRVEAVYLAAALPPNRRLRRLEIPLVKLRQRRTGDDALRSRLARLGGFDGALDDADVAFLMRVFRRDVAASLDYFERAYRRAAAPLRAPVVALLGDRDPFTRGLFGAGTASHRAWRFFAERVEREVIAGGSHYFLNHQARELAAVLVHRTRAAAAKNTAPSAPSTPNGSPTPSAVATPSDAPTPSDVPASAPPGSRASVASEVPLSAA
jgi:amino acid adenylation domain-containing protein